MPRSGPAPDSEQITRICTIERWFELGRAAAPIRRLSARFSLERLILAVIADPREGPPARSRGGLPRLAGSCGFAWWLVAQLGA